MSLEILYARYSVLVDNLNRSIDVVSFGFYRVICGVWGSPTSVQSEERVDETFCFGCCHRAGGIADRWRVRKESAGTATPGPNRSAPRGDQADAAAAAATTTGRSTARGPD